MSAPAREAALARVECAWGAAAPAWVLALARACDADSDAAVARRLGYSHAVISQVLRKKYGAGMSAVEQRVRALLMADTRACPALGEIRLAACLDHQSRPFSSATPTNIRMFGACRSGCPHSNLGGKHG